jgi:hypothetical protein
MLYAFFALSAAGGALAVNEPLAGLFLILTGVLGARASVSLPSTTTPKGMSAAATEVTAADAQRSRPTATKGEA